MNGISALLLSLSTMRGCNKKSAAYNLEANPYLNLTVLTLYSQTFSLQNCEKKFTVAYKTFGLWSLVIAA